MNLNKLLEVVKEAALKGGEEILKIYEGGGREGVGMLQTSN